MLITILLNAETIHSKISPDPVFKHVLKEPSVNHCDMGDH